MQQGVILDRGKQDWERDFSEQGLTPFCMLMESTEASILQDAGNQHIVGTERAAEYEIREASMVTTPSSGLSSSLLMMEKTAWHPRAAGPMACTAFLMLDPTCTLSGDSSSQSLCKQSCGSQKPLTTVYLSNTARAIPQCQLLIAFCRHDPNKRAVGYREV